MLTNGNLKLSRTFKYIKRGIGHYLSIHMVIKSLSYDLENIFSMLSILSELKSIINVMT